MAASSILSAAHLTAGHVPGTPVLDDVSLDVRPGDYIGIVGPNGSGKTSLLRALLGLLPATSGDVRLFGTPLAQFREWHRVGYLPQAAALPFPRFPASVAEIVSTGRLPRLRFPRYLRRADREAVARILERLDLAPLARRMIGDLSGGQLQRVCLARALASEPELLLLDEPTSALDPAFRESFYTLLADLHAKGRTTILLVTHDTSTIGAHASRLLYLDRTVIFDGPFADFCHSPQMTAYFGPAAQHVLCGQHVPHHPHCPGTAHDHATCDVCAAPHPHAAQ